MRRWAKYGPQENQRCFLKKPWIIPFELVFFFIADLWKTWTVHEKFWKTWLPPFFSPLVYYIIFDVSYAKFNLATCSIVKCSVIMLTSLLKIWFFAIDSFVAIRDFFLKIKILIQVLKFFCRCVKYHTKKINFLKWILCSIKKRKKK